jgi:hypothetical protein
MLLGMDGSYDVGPDRGLRFDAGDAVGGALAVLPPGRAVPAHMLQVQAEASFRRAAEALGLPEPPASPAVDRWAPLVDAATGALSGVLSDELVDRAVRGGVPDFLPGRR